MSAPHLLQLLRGPLAALAVAITALACDFTVPATVPDAIADLRPDAARDAAPDAALVPEVGSTMVAASSLSVDLARPGDGAITTDGNNDGVFDVQLIGPVVALAVIRTDAAGMPMGNQQWDTWVGNDAITAELGTSFAVGASTYQLGAYDASGTVLLNDPSGRLALPAGRHAVRVAGANVGSFIAGNHFRAIAERPDGVLVRGPIVAY